jgi:putative endonuclease
MEVMPPLGNPARRFARRRFQKTLFLIQYLGVFDPYSGSLDYHVNIVQSLAAGKCYTGQAGNLPERLAQHNDPQHNPRKLTSRNPGSWVLIFSKSFDTYPEAVRYERWLKSGTGRQWIREQFGPAGPPKPD